MLDLKTKSAIDKARQILVGKIPNPSTQVEQITLAMLYKFMDDMDQESIQLGGQATFFSGNYEQYSWKNIMSNKISSYERYNKYTEGLEKFYSHPRLPQTFKDVFKNASVPFKEPDILTLFLKEIDTGLSYGDSEQLGDAYEYLLSVLGSQGDLGQFRTPRNIIDFMVEITAPKKNDLILDPACGTAGFLISAYRYILKENTDKRLGDKLNFDERMEILKHITGYDIEPSMVRIAEMNMFLHGANDPDITEYDTLTMEDKWEEKFDVILANPPFMTPKGGIKPHSKFSIKANRSEILFVEYILRHTKRNGRGAVVVPDGIVSNSGRQSKSYVELRKLLLESKSVYAVVSLHPYVFKPYADVKTSIIFFDKSIQTDKVLFVTVANDGFEKGERRREIEANDLPEAKKIILKFHEDLANGNLIEQKSIESDVQNVIVSYDKIKNSSYLLRGERYLVGKTLNENVNHVLFGDITEEVKGKSEPQDTIYSISNKRGFIKSDDYFKDYFEVDDKEKYNRIVNGTFAFNPARINVGSIALYENDVPGCISPMYKRFKIKDDYLEKINPKYLLAIMKSEYARSFINNKRTGVRGSVDLDALSSLKIPVPNNDEQKIIASKMNMIEKLSESKDTIKFSVLEDDEWKKVPITELFDFEKGSQQISKNKTGKYSLVTTSSIVDSDHYDYDEEAICVPMISSKGHGVAELKKIFYINGKFCCGDILMVMRKKANTEFNMKFYYYYFSTYLDKYFTRLMTGTSNVGFTLDDVKNIEIPYPEINVQDRITNEGLKYEIVIQNIETLETECFNQIDQMISNMQKQKD